VCLVILPAARWVSVQTGSAMLKEVLLLLLALSQKVTYNAEQITKEMQGVRVTGFVVWYIIHYFTALL